MAKTYRKRRYYRRKGRWSANIRTLTEQTINASPNSSFYASLDLCSNPFQTDSTVSQQYTVKNIELSYEIEGRETYSYNVESLVVYIMYVPQGMTITETYPNQHPEYILAYRFLGSPNEDSGGPTRLPSKISTRLARRLQTGDKIIFLVTGYNDHSTGTAELKLNGLVRWWTKAN